MKRNYLVFDSAKSCSNLTNRATPKVDSFRSVIMLFFLSNSCLFDSDSSTFTIAGSSRYHHKRRLDLSKEVRDILSQVLVTRCLSNHSRERVADTQKHRLSIRMLGSPIKVYFLMLKPSRFAEYAWPISQVCLDTRKQSQWKQWDQEAQEAVTRVEHVLKTYQAILTAASFHGI